MSGQYFSLSPENLLQERLTLFAGGSTGTWRVERMKTITGAPLGVVSHVAVITGKNSLLPRPGSFWLLRGVPSYVRYVERSEKEALAAKQPGLGRPEATRAALISIAKSPVWWDLPQDERRAIFETRSRHISNSLKYLPAIARQLYHCRDLGEPFDFLTWFEFAPEYEGAFDELVAYLRHTEEWTFVLREIDIRLTREIGNSGNRDSDHFTQPLNL